MAPRTQGSYVFGLMALLILAMAMILPAIGGEFGGAASPSETRIVSPQMRVFEMQRSALTHIEGGTYFRGTSLEEVQSAIDDCAACDLTQAESAVPAHQLTVNSFWMEITEVTYAQYIAFLNTLGSGGHRNGCGGHLCIVTQAENVTSSIVQTTSGYATTSTAVDDYPVVDVTWYGAKAYCEALGRRLPTEGEWEFAARGASGTLYPWGNEWSSDAANIRGSVKNEAGVIIAAPEPVGVYGDYASPDGIRELAGNVAEWTADWYDPGYYLTLDATRPNDLGPAEGTEKAVRGGSWNDAAFFARSVNRQSLAPDATLNDVGFRCVADS